MAKGKVLLTTTKVKLQIDDMPFFCSFELVSRKHSKTFTRERNKRHRNKQINNRRKINTNKEEGKQREWMDTHMKMPFVLHFTVTLSMWVSMPANQNCQILFKSFMKFKLQVWIQYKNLFKYVQTSMVLFHCSWESFSILWKYIQILTLYYIQCVTQ